MSVEETDDLWALTCGQVCQKFGFVVTKGARKGEPKRSVLYSLVKEGRFPPPIDPDLAYAYWRFPIKDLQAYAEGRWKAGAA